MMRFLYWLSKCIRGNNKFCKHFCVSCEHYEMCKRDGVMD